MKKIVFSKKNLTREAMSSPIYKDLYEKLEEIGAVNLINNSKYEDFGNGYGRLVAIDSNKKISKKEIIEVGRNITILPVETEIIYDITQKKCYKKKEEKKFDLKLFALAS